MAARRMFKVNFIQDDQFMSMKNSSQILYIRLLGNADDEGFVNNVRMLCRSEKSLQELIDNDLIYRFDSGIVLIRHWHQHNRVRKQVFKATVFEKEKALVILDSSEVYNKKSAQNVRTNCDTV